MTDTLVEPTAWLYTSEIQELTFFEHSKRPDYVEAGYTETPLYAPGEFEEAFQMTAEAAATHLKTAMDRQDRIIALEADVARLLGVAGKIAKQHLTSEMEEPSGADYEAGYESIIKFVRAALAALGENEMSEDFALNMALDNNATLVRHIEAQAAEIEKLREALKEVFEAWAGSEGFIPETAPEGYLLYLTKRMAHIAREAMGDTQ